MPAAAPPLLRGLPGNAEPGGDLRPAVPLVVQSGDALPDRVIEFADGGGHVRDRVDVAGRDAARPGAQDAAGERGVLVVLGDPPSPPGCQAAVDTGPRPGIRRGHRLIPAVATASGAVRTIRRDRLPAAGLRAALLRADGVLSLIGVLQAWKGSSPRAGWPWGCDR